MCAELGSYKHLRYIDLSGNKIPNIDSLAQMPHVLTLNLSGSELTSLEVFNRETAFTFLQTLDLSGNKCAALTALQLPRLVTLNLMKN